MTIDFDYPTALERIAANAQMRRELLWLLAKVKGDEPAMRELESVQTGLAERMNELVREFCARQQRRDPDFWLLYDERFELYASEVCRHV